MSGCLFDEAPTSINYPQCVYFVYLVHTINSVRSGRTKVLHARSKRDPLRPLSCDTRCFDADDCTQHTFAHRSPVKTGVRCGLVASGGSQGEAYTLMQMPLKLKSTFLNRQRDNHLSMRFYAFTIFDNVHRCVFSSVECRFQHYSLSCRRVMQNVRVGPNFSQLRSSDLINPCVRVCVRRIWHKFFPHSRARVSLRTNSAAHVGT